jgi:hypothetical protein
MHNSIPPRHIPDSRGKTPLGQSRPAGSPSRPSVVLPHVVIGGKVVRRTTIILLACLGAGLGNMIPLAPGRAETGYDFYQICLKESRGQGFECLRYIHGLWDGVVLAGYPYICPEEDVQLGQLELIFMNWAHDNPDRLGISVQFAVITAFAKAFPCHKK